MSIRVLIVEDSPVMQRLLAEPHAPDGQALAEFGVSIADKLRAAARAALPPRMDRKAAAPRTLEGPADRRQLEGQLIAIGASTGGTEAVREILQRLPREVPPILVVQHMPEMFTRMFAKRLDD